MVLKGVTAAAGALCVALVIRAACTAPLRLPLNYNEGWNAYHTADLIAGRPLYPPPSRLFPNNYPPLSFLAVAAVTPTIGDPLVAGRVVALLAFASWVAALAVAARRLGCTPVEAAAGAAIFAGWMLVTRDDYVGVDDPQILGHAVQAWALVLLLGRWNATAGLLLATGLFIKHTLIAMPAAVVATVLASDRRAAWRTLAGLAAGLIAWAAAGFALFGVDVVSIASTRGWIPGKWLSMTLTWLPAWIPFAALALVLARRSARERGVDLVLAYAASGVASGVLLLGGDGVYWNALFDAQWALALAAAVAWNRLGRNDQLRRAAAVGVCALPLAVALSMHADRHWLSPRFWLDPHWFEASTAAADIDFLRSRPGAVLCENLALCFWGGKTAEVDFFDLQQRVRVDPGRAEPLVRRIEAQEFSALLLDGPVPRRDLGPRTADAIRRLYRIDHFSQWGTFLVPR